MRRLGIVIALLAACAAAAVAASNRADGDGTRYTLELDNAFGLVDGADVKVAGVRAGRVTGMRVDPRSERALIDFELTRDGFGSLRTDVFCETRPQSLIGEYFVDCRPGTNKRRLEPGATIPVVQTASTIPIDLINNIMRRPYRERLGILLDELGTGVGARASDIRATLERALPALRETDRVLAILAEQNRVLADLATNADTVIGDLAANRRDVGAFVTEARQTAATAADRRAAIAAGLRRLPGFLRELEPTLAKLGAAADAQAPALQDLNASADQLERLLVNLEPFADASRESLDALAKAGKDGRPALTAAKPAVAELNRFSTDTPELANNLALVLDDLDDRDRAVEKDPRSPGGQGYTGFEALLQYVFDQAMAINTFDSNGYMLKVNLFLSKCSQYQNPASLRKKLQQDPGFYKDCAAILGPSQPGITQRDPSYTGAQEDAGRQPPSPLKQRSQRAERPAQTPTPTPEPKRPATPPAAPAPPRPPAATPSPTPAERRAERRAAEQLKQRLEDTLGIELPETPALPPPAENLPQLPSETQPLLDFLLGP
jgi:virulence factor Mce-like protein